MHLLCIERDAWLGVSLLVIGLPRESRIVFQALKQWYVALSPRRRTLYGVLISVIVATIPCYCIGAWALTQSYPAAPPPAIVATATETHTPVPPTSTPVPTATSVTSMPTATLEPTPTQQPSATATPTALPTETPTFLPSPEPTMTPTGTATATPTDTPLPTATATATNTPSLSGTISPPPELILVPLSGPPGAPISISGKYFARYRQYSIYWDTPELRIGDTLADDQGQLNPLFYSVPLTASVGVHQVVAELDGTVVARVPFTVTAVD